MTFFFTLPCIAVILTTLYYFLTWPYDYWKKQKIPTAKLVIPGFGNTLSIFLLRDNLNFICNRLYKNCSPNSSMFGIFYFRTPALIIRDPELVQTVLIKKFSNFCNNVTYLDEHRDWFLSKNPFFGIGETWKRSRKLTMRGMSQKKLKVMFESMHRISGGFDDYFNQIDNTEVDLRDICSRFICEILCQTGYGIKPDGNFLAMVNKLFESTWFREIRQLLNFSMRDLANLTGISYVPIEVQRFFGDLAKSLKKMHKTEEGLYHDDFLHMVMESSEDVNEEMVLSTLSSLFFDGYDTASNVATIALYRLAWNQNVQGKLRQEIFETLKKCDEKLTYDILNDMTYFDHVINETLRLNPILEINAKICNETTTLEGSDGLKCTLQPGNIVVIPTRSLHMDEKYWDNPNVFDPDRFCRSEVTKFAFLPFGEGPRMCPGMRFGLLEVKILLISILKKFKVEITDKTVNTLEMDPSSYLQVIKEQLIVKLQKIET